MSKIADELEAENERLRAALKLAEVVLRLAGEPEPTWPEVDEVLDAIAALDADSAARASPNSRRNHEVIQSA